MKVSDAAVSVPLPARASRPRVLETLKRHLLLGTLVALAILTIVIFSIPWMHFNLWWPGGSMQIAVAGAVISLLTSALAYVWWSVTGARSTLFVGVAFLVLSVNQLVFGVIVEPAQNPASAQRQVYFWIAGRMVAALLLLIGAWHRRLDDSPARHPLLVFVGTASAALLTLALIQTVLWGEQTSLPLLCCAGLDRLPTDGVSPGITPLALFVGTVGTLVYLAAAYLFRPQPQAGTYPRGEWLSIALVFAAFSHLHFMLAPTVFSDRIATGDLLRVAQFVFLFFGLLVEVRLLLEQERDRSMQLAALNEMKDQVSRIVTHDLLHSIATLRAFSFHLDERWDNLDDERRREAVGRIDRQAKRLGSLADDTVAALDAPADRIELTMRPEKIVDLVQEAADAVDCLDGRLELRVQEGSNVMAMVDGGAVVRVLLNLLWNAEEHSPAGRPVTIGITDDGAEVIVTVTDEGAGFAMRDAGGSSRPAGGVASAARPGWGVGLRRSRVIIEAHGGRLWVESAPGRGTTVSVGLPRIGATDE